MKIGVYDSGVGGLVVLKSILKRLPEYDYVYLGDNARAPYGNLSSEKVFDYASEAVEYLFFEKDCRLVIAACNTVSAEALRRLQQEYLPANAPDRTILGVIVPIVEESVRHSHKRIGVLATRSTVASNAYPNEIAKRLPQTEVIQHAAPLLVPLIEEAMGETEAAREILRGYLRPFIENPVDSLILGCTHYPILINTVREMLPDETVVFDAPEIVAQKLAEYLQKHPEIQECLSTNGRREFMITDKVPHYKELAERLLESKVELTICHI